MYYIEQVEDEYVKYEIYFNEIDLKILRDRIIENCGEIIHRCYFGTVDNYKVVNKYDIAHIKRYKEKYVRYSSKHGSIYVYSYDQYLDTRLSELIDLLLAGDSSVIFEIKNPIVKKMRKTEKLRNPEKRLNRLLTKEKISEKEACKLKELKQELKDYKNYQKLNKNRETDLKYYPLVLASINMKEVGRISADKVMNFQNLKQQANSLMEKENGIVEELSPFFIGTNQEDILSLGLKKVL